MSELSPETAQVRCPFERDECDQPECFHDVDECAAAFTASVDRQVSAPETDVLACCEHCEGAPTTRCWVADSIDGHAEPCSECHGQDALPSFVRSLSPGGTEAAPIELAPEVRDRLECQLGAMRAARDRAAVTAQSYIVGARGEQVCRPGEQA